MLKKLAISIVILIIAIGGIAGYLFSNMDDVIKAAIEKYGTAVTGTRASVSNVHISVSSGEGKISGLTINNPPDFSGDKAFEMGAISVKIDTGSISGNGPIIINDISIDDPHLALEVVNNITCNMGIIGQNAKNYTGASGKHRENEAGDPDDGSKKPERKIIINNLHIRGGKLKVTHNLLKDRTITAQLSDIELTGIGKETGGVTPAEAAKQILSSITTTAINDANKILAPHLNALKDALKEGTAHEKIDKIKNLLR